MNVYLTVVHYRFLAPASFNCY